MESPTWEGFSISSFNCWRRCEALPCQLFGILTSRKQHRELERQVWVSMTIWVGVHDAFNIVQYGDMENHWTKEGLPLKSKRMIRTQNPFLSKNLFWEHINEYTLNAIVTYFPWVWAPNLQTLKERCHQRVKEANLTLSIMGLKLETLSQKGCSHYISSI